MFVEHLTALQFSSSLWRVREFFRCYLLLLPIAPEVCDLPHSLLHHLRCLFRGPFCCTSRVIWQCVIIYSFGHCYLWCGSSCFVLRLSYFLEWVWLLFLWPFLRHKPSAKIQETEWTLEMRENMRLNSDKKSRGGCIETPKQANEKLSPSIVISW